MCDGLAGIGAALVRVAGSLDAEAVTSAEAARLLGLAATIERTAAGLTVSLAARAARSAAWQQAGAASSAHQLARETGLSLGAAAERIEVGRRLGEQPELARAAAAGGLSAPQLAAVSQAAAADPQAAPRLLEVAARRSLGELKDECRRVQAAADRDGDARRARIYARRSLRSFTDSEGVGHLNLLHTPETVAGLMASLGPVRDQLFQAARRAGRRERSDALDADALVAAVQAATGQTSTGRRRVGGPGGTAEALDLLGHGWPGSGPPPAAAAQAGPPEPGARPAAAARAGAAAAEPPSDRQAGLPGAGPPRAKDPARSAGADGVELDRVELDRVEPDRVESDRVESDRVEPDRVEPDRRGPPPPDPLPGLQMPGLQTSGVQASGLRPPGGGPGLPAPTPARMLVRVDLDALLRGYPIRGELCEVAGYGPVAVSAVKDMIATGNSVLVAIATRGEKVTGVARVARKLSVAQQAALEWLQPDCVAEGCHSTRRLERDHDTPWAQSKVTLLEGMNHLCGHHHDLKTNHGYVLLPGFGKRPFVAPSDPRHPRHPRAAKARTPAAGFGSAEDPSPPVQDAPRLRRPARAAGRTA